MLRKVGLRVGCLYIFTILNSEVCVLVRDLYLKDGAELVRIEMRVARAVCNSQKGRRRVVLCPIRTTDAFGGARQRYTASQPLERRIDRRPGCG